MELKHIKELMSAMGRTGIKRLSVKKDNFELQLEREADETVRIIEPPMDFLDERLDSGEKLLRRADMAFSKGGHVTTTPPASSKNNSGEAREGDNGPFEEEGQKGHYVKSPMVGTFYLMPSPDEPPYIKVGDTIQEDTIVCIIEAMKVMNEIKAGVSGVVKEVLVDNSHPVEFGTPLFKIV